MARDPALIAEVNRPQRSVTRRLNVWRNDQWSATNWVMSSYSISPLVTPGGIAISDSEKAEALADNLEAQFQPVTDPSVPAVIEMVDVALRS